MNRWLDESLSPLPPACLLIARGLAGAIVDLANPHPWFDSSARDARKTSQAIRDLNQYSGNPAISALLAAHHSPETLLIGLLRRAGTERLILTAPTRLPAWRRLDALSKANIPVWKRLDLLFRTPYPEFRAFAALQQERPDLVAALQSPTHRCIALAAPILQRFQIEAVTG